MSPASHQAAQRTRKRGPIGLAVLLASAWAGFTLAAGLLLAAAAAIAWPHWRVSPVVEQERIWVLETQPRWVVALLIRSDDALQQVKALVRPVLTSLLHDGESSARPRLAAAWDALKLAVLRGLSTFATLMPLMLLGLALACDGLVERDRRRWGADTESAWIYHFAKSAVTWWIGILLLLRLLSPAALHPHLFLVTTALTAGPLLSLTFARFKKHL